MKTNIIFTILVVFLMGCAGTLSHAQSYGDDITVEGFYGEEIQSPFLPADGTQKPAPTKGQQVALVFYKFAGQLPDFEDWAKQTEAYKKADPFESSRILDIEMERLKDRYVLTTVSDSVIVYTPVTLASYSFRNKGFIVAEGFSDDTFFPFEYAGRHYALVVPKLSLHQWLSVTDEEVAMKIDIMGEKTNHQFQMMMDVEPTYADPQNQIFLNGKNYWLISARVRKLSLYPIDGNDERLWTNETVSEDGFKQKELLNLYR